MSLDGPSRRADKYWDDVLGLAGLALLGYVTPILTGGLRLKTE